LCREIEAVDRGTAADDDAGRIGRDNVKMVRRRVNRGGGDAEEAGGADGTGLIDGGVDCDDGEKVVFEAPVGRKIWAGSARRPMLA